MPRFKTLPPSSEIDRVIRAASKTVFDYTISSAREGLLRGSGTLVTIEGVKGILTADHVAQDWMSPGPPVMLLFAYGEHRLFLNPKLVEHHQVGEYTRKTASLGPDLAFLQLHDLKLIAELEAKKSFLPLEQQLGDPLMGAPKSRIPWLVAGSPQEWGVVKAKKGYSTVAAAGLAGHGIYRRRTVRGDFDYLTLSLMTGDKGFPSNFEGMSGGGVWALLLMVDQKTDPPTVSAAGPFFRGVTFYQRAPKSGRRLLYCHGPDSNRLLVDLVSDFLK